MISLGKGRRRGVVGWLMLGFVVALAAPSVAGGFSLGAYDYPGWAPVHTGGEQFGPVYGAVGHTALWTSADELAFQSLDGGLTWLPLPGEPVWPITVTAKPNAPETWLTLKIPNEVWRSRDAGATWRLLTLPQGDADFVQVSGALEYAPDGAVWALLDFAWRDGRRTTRLAVSRNDGDTWRLIDTPFPDGGRLVVHTWRPDRLWVVDGRGTWQTDDGGQRWVLSPTTLPMSAQVDPFNANVVWAVAQRRLLRSNDLGFSWQPVTELGSPNATVTAFAVDRYRPGRLFAATGERDLWTSQDGGARWNRFPGPPIGRGDRVRALAVPTNGAGSLFVSAERGLYRTTDAGAAWVEAVGFNSRPFRHVIALNNALVGLFAWNGAFLTSVDGGSAWQGDLARAGGASPDILTQDPRQPNRLYATRGLGQVFRSEDGGNSWAENEGYVDPGLIPQALAIDPARPNRLWLGGVRVPGNQSYVPLLWRSDDYGRNWLAVANDNGPRDYINGLTLIEGRPPRLYVAAEKLFRTDDEGETWQDFPVTGDGVVSALVDPADPTTIFAGTARQGLYVSRDDGRSWAWVRQLRSDGAVRLLRHPVNSRVWYAIAFAPELLEHRDLTPPWRPSLHRADDAGANWTDITGPLAHTVLRRGLLFATVPLSQPNRLYVGGDAGAWVFNEPSPR